MTVVVPLWMPASGMMVLGVWNANFLTLLRDISSGAAATRPQRRIPLRNGFSRFGLTLFAYRVGGALIGRPDRRRR
jgi:hypothetical protein